MKRFVSNLILGLFVVMLIAVYGIAKQPAVFSVIPDSDDTQLTQIKATQPMAVRLPSGRVVRVQIASTPSELNQGLSGRDQLSDSEGMLLVFPEVGLHSIWMKDMNIPLDIIWLDEDGEVVHLAENVPVPADTSNLPVYVNEQPAKYVLELAAGTASEVGLEVGESVTFS